MAWPSPNTAATSSATWSPNFNVNGLSTIVWGTEGLYTGYIVVSANESQRIEEINIEQGAGFEAIVILLNKGLDVEMEVIDDTSVSAPSAGSIVTFSTPYGSTPMLLVANKANQARKREGMRTFTFKSFNAITGLH
jgi:hypothetical protein